MAFRRRRRFGGFRRRRQVASAFAPAKAGAQNLGWEAAGTTCWSNIEQVLPLAGDQYNVTCDGAAVPYQTRGLILIPVNDVRGTVTLMRVRGFLGTFNIDVAQSQADLRNRTVHFLLQLVPKDPDLVNTPDGLQLLSGNKVVDQESNRIIAQWVCLPSAGQYGVVRSEGTGTGDLATMMQEVDVRVKRRFARSQWALVLSATTTVAGFDGITRMYSNFRMLFKTGDGI